MKTLHSNIKRHGATQQQLHADKLSAGATKQRVRLVKRNEKSERGERGLAATAPAAEAAVQNRELTRDGRQAVITTVSSWVREFQQRHAVETRRSFASLFKEPAPTVSSIS